MSEERRNVGSRIAGSIVGMLLVLGGLVAIAAVEDRHSLRASVGLKRSPQELMDRARTIMLDMGLMADEPEDYRPADDARIDSFGGSRYFHGNYQSNDEWASGFRYDHDAIGFTRAEINRDDAHYEIRDDDPRLIQFWYREAHVGFQRSSPDRYGPKASGVAGDIEFLLDSAGRLQQLEWTPPQYEGPYLYRFPVFLNGDERKVEHAGAEGPRPGWDYFFEQAGLDPTDFEPTDPLWNPRSDCNTELAWIEIDASTRADRQRVEACESNQRASYFEVVSSWKQPDREEGFTSTSGITGGGPGTMLFALAVLAVGVVVARRNIRKGSAPTNGALRVSVYVVAAGALGMLFRLPEFVPADQPLILAGLAALAYLSLGPWVRSHWPVCAQPWDSLVAGRFLDPRVGRSVLTGLACGTLLVLSIRLVAVQAADWPIATALPFGTLRRSMGQLLLSQFPALMLGLLVTIAVTWLRGFLRRDWVTASVAVLLGTVALTLLRDESLFSAAAIQPLLISLFIVVAVVGGGFLASAFTAYLLLIAEAIPLTLQLGSWHAGQSVLLMTLVALLALYGGVVGGRAPRVAPA